MFIHFALFVWIFVVWILVTHPLPENFNLDLWNNWVEWTCTFGGNLHLFNLTSDLWWVPWDRKQNVQAVTKILIELYALSSVLTNTASFLIPVVILEKSCAAKSLCTVASILVHSSVLSFILSIFVFSYACMKKKWIYNRHVKCLFAKQKKQPLMKQNNTNNQ